MSEELRENTESSGFVCVRLSGSKPAESSEKPESNAPAAETVEPEIQTEPIDLNPVEPAEPEKPSGPIELNPIEEVPEEPAEPEKPSGPIELNPIEETPEEPAEPEKPAGPIELNPIEKMPEVLAEAEKPSGPIDLNPAEDVTTVTAERNKQLGSLEVSSEKNLPAVIDIPNNQTGSTGNAPETTEISMPKKHAWGKAKQSAKVSVIGVSVLLIGVIAALLYFSASRGSAAVRDAFERTKEEVAGMAYQKFYETSYNAAEHDYHVKNRAIITLSGIREETELEVLSVSDIVYMIKNKNDIFDTRLWLEVPGTGVFTVNLAAGEFLVDNERNSVYVSLPRPSVSADTIEVDLGNVKVLEEESHAIGSSILEGEELVLQQLNEAQIKIREDIMSNKEYNEYAEESARSLLETWIRAVNKDVEDLTVEIEFY